MAKFDAVDDTLKEFGIPKVHRKLRKCLKRVIIGGFVCLLICITYNMYKQQYGTQNIFLALILLIVLNHLICINLIVDLSFIFLLWSDVYRDVYSDVY